MASSRVAFRPALVQSQQWAPPRPGSSTRMAPARPAPRAPAPPPLPTSPSPSMVSLMSEIVVKADSRPARARPQSAVYGRTGSSEQQSSFKRPQSAAVMPQRMLATDGGMSDASGGGVACGSTAGASALTAAGKPSSAQGQRTALRKSVKPPDGSRFPRDSANFMRQTPAEKQDQRDGVGGTSLPGAASLLAVRRKWTAIEAMKRGEKAERRQLAVEKARDALMAKARVRVPDSQRKFAWGPDRISHALICKFDQFTSRQEDHTRKLLWSIGTDPNFRDPLDPTVRSAVRLTPDNFPKVCDRFGVQCDPAQARQIFEKHGLPTEGCSVAQLSRSFIDSKIDTATIVRDQVRRMHGDSARPAAAVRPHTPVKRHNPYAHAFIPAEAWAKHEGARPADGA